MKTNVGGLDRVVRIALGAVLMGMAIKGVIGNWGWLGAVPFVTGLVGWCPPYALFGWNTCSTRS